MTLTPTETGPQLETDAPRGGGRSLRPGVPSPLPRRAVWLRAIRPATLPASASGVVVGLGAALAVHSPFRLDAAALCLGVALLLQIAANLANDLSDFRHGADLPERVGPLRVAVSGLVTPRELERAIAAVLALAAVAGLLLAVVGGPSVVAVGAAAILAALAYTGGPWPYGYHALGEPFVFLFFGVAAVVWTAFLQAGRFEPLFFAASIPVGALVTAILVVNNLRDIGTDAAAGKRTLAVIVGERASEVELAALAVAAYLVPLALTPSRGLFVLTPIATVPLAIRLAATVRAGGDPRRLNGVLKGTARLSFLYSVLFAAGLALSA